MNWQAVILTASLAYLLGSIPFGFVLVRAFRGEDIRKSGSGNIGATNVARSSPLLGIITLILDALKGLAAVLITRMLFPREFELPAIAALFAVVGHVFPVWLRFRGGKGVATGLGSLILIAPKSAAAAAAIFAIVFLMFRFVSLASLVAVLLFSLLAFLLDRCAVTPVILIACGCLIILFKHSANIRRLAAGTEPRFQWKSK